MHQIRENEMGRPFLLPDPKDRSVNTPSCVVSPNQILGYYNQENKEDRKERIVDSVKEWYTTTALENGWAKADFHGNQCVLHANIKLGK